MAFEALLARARVLFEADDRKLRQSTKRITREAETTSVAVQASFQKGIRRGAEDAGRSVELLGARLGAVRAILLSPAFVAAAGLGVLITGLASAVKASKEFQAEFANVTTLFDTGVVATEQIKESLLGLPPILGSSLELTRALYQAISAGAEPAAAVELVGKAALLARAGLTTTFKSVDILTTILNSYGLEAVEATRVSDVLFKTVEKGKTTIDELASALGRVIPFASTLGITIEDLGAAVATLTKGGLATDIAITALRGAFGALIQQADKFRELGIDIIKVAGEEGIVGVMKAIKEATEGDIEAIRELIPDQRALVAVLALTGKQFDELIEIQKATTAAQGATAEAAQKQFETFNARLTEFSNTIERFKISVGTPFLGLLTDIFKTLSFFADEARKAADAVTKLSGATKESLPGLRELVESIIPGARVFRGIAMLAGDAEAAIDKTEKAALDAVQAQEESQERLTENQKTRLATQVQERLKSNDFEAESLKILEEAQKESSAAQLEVIVSTIDKEKAERKRIAEFRKMLEFETATDLQKIEQEASLARLKIARDLAKEQGEGREVQLELEKKIADQTFQISSDNRARELEALRRQLIAIEGTGREQVEERKKIEAEITKVREAEGKARTIFADQQLLREVRISKRAADEQKELEQELFEFRQTLGEITLQEEINRLRTQAEEEGRTIQERIDLQEEAFQKEQALRDARRSGAVRILEAVKKSLKEQGIEEASLFDITSELQRQREEVLRTASEQQTSLLVGGRANVEQLIGSLKGLGQVEEIDRLTKSLGGVGTILTESLTPQTDVISNAATEIVTSYEDAFASIERRAERFGNNIERSIGRATERLRDNIDQVLARKLEFAGTRL